MIHVISLGAGVQSSTMALMAAHGEITPMPSCAIFADTQDEPKAVYTWLDWLEKQLPFPVYRVSKGSLSKHELGADMRNGSRPILICYRTRKPSGDIGLIRRQCTAHFKIQPIDRKLAQLRNRGMVTLWQGISTDEAQRMKPARQKYKTHRFPLIEKDMTRGHCVRWTWDKYKRTAPRSACKQCPMKGPEEWRTMTPEEFEWACLYDESMRDRGGEQGKLYVWRNAIPLREVDFRNASDMGQTALFGDECEGMCGV